MLSNSQNEIPVNGKLIFIGHIGGKIGVIKNNK